MFRVGKPFCVFAANSFETLLPLPIDHSRRALLLLEVTLKQHRLSICPPTRVSKEPNNYDNCEQKRQAFTSVALAISLLSVVELKLRGSWNVSNISDRGA